MPGADRQIIRGQGLIAEKMQYIEALAQLDQLFVIFEIAAAPPACNVMDIRCARHHAEMNMPATNSQRTLRVGRGQSKNGRRAGNRRQDQAAVSPHDHRGLINIGTGSAKAGARIGTHHFDTVFFQQLQRRLMNCLKLISTQRGQWRQVGLDVLPACQSA